MKIILLLIVLSAIVSFFRAKIFEGLLWSLLVSPILAYLLHGIFGMTGIGYWVITLSVLGVWGYSHKGELSSPSLKTFSEYSTIGILLVTYLLVLLLTSEWDQFIPMGERLRDYGILSSVLRSPYEVKDPWLHGYALNYYAYWYRFGHYLSSLLGLTAPELYIQMPALTFSLYLATVYRLTTRFLGWSWISALFVGVIIAFGSNLEGIFHALKGSHDWWGPSRVIPGAIHEFPVWSLLLGDLHPHFLNLVGIPALLLLYLDRYESWRLDKNLIGFSCLTLAFLMAGALFIFNTNAWEVPIWGLVLGSVSLSLLILNRGSWGGLSTLTPLPLKAVQDPRFLTSFASTVAISISLYWSSRNILPNPYPVSLVSDPIPRTAILDFLRHWGIPAGLLLCNLLALRGPWTMGLSLLYLVFGILVMKNIIPLLGLGIVLLAIYHLHKLYRSPHSSSTKESVLYPLSICSLTLLLIPEFVFLNDPYGGENERMNTIFKIYASAWALFHLSAFGLFREHILPLLKLPRMVLLSIYPASIVLLLSFLWEIAPVRSITPKSSATAYASLASAEDNFPGSAASILFLRDFPNSVVLEAQGNAYDWTSFVATLSNNDSYLGWANHVNLLIRDYGEISRRENITKEFYSSPSCLRRSEILRQENITFAVLGTLEEKKYPGALTLDYSCLKIAYSQGNYKIFKN